MEVGMVFMWIWNEGRVNIMYLIMTCDISPPRQRWPVGWRSSHEAPPPHSARWSQWSCDPPWPRPALQCPRATNCRSAIFFKILEKTRLMDLSVNWPLRSGRWSPAGTWCPASWSWPQPPGDTRLRSASQRSCSYSSEICCLLQTPSKLWVLSLL